MTWWPLHSDSFRQSFSWSPATNTPSWNLVLRVNAEDSGYDTISCRRQVRNIHLVSAWYHANAGMHWSDVKQTLDVCWVVLVIQHAWQMIRGNSVADILVWANSSAATWITKPCGPKIIPCNETLNDKSYSIVHFALNSFTASSVVLQCSRLWPRKKWENGDEAKRQTTDVPYICISSVMFCWLGLILTSWIYVTNIITELLNNFWFPVDMKLTRSQLVDHAD